MNMNTVRKDGSTRRGFLGGAFGAFAGMMAVGLPVRSGVSSPKITGKGKFPIGNDQFKAALEVNKRLIGLEDPYGFERVGNYIKGDWIDYAVWQDNGWNPFTIVDWGYYRTTGNRYVVVPTYDICNAIDWKLDYTMQNRDDIISRAIQVYIEGFRKKIFMDRWQTILAVGGNPEWEAPTLERLIQNAQYKYANNGKCLGRERKWSDVVVSPEAWDNWVNEDCSRKGSKPSKVEIGGATIHVFDELGIGCELWKFYQEHINTAQEELRKRDFAIFIDNRYKDAFGTVKKHKVLTFINPSLHQQQRSGIYGWCKAGHTVLTDRNVAIGTFQ